MKMSPAPNRIHQKVSIQLNNLLWLVTNNKKCSFYAVPFDVRLHKTN